MTLLDWLVVAAYMIGMMAVGWYYARRTQSTDDYLLGDRRIGFTSIGLSLFASLLSAVSYLARPGEMIEHGPMIAADVLTYPIVYLVVGYGLIPFFMKQRATSAYELLEERLGLGVRLLGSTLFLALRLIWMGVVIYVSASKIIVPIAQLPRETIPYVCMVMGLVTVSYTSLGGLRAVVITDVIQTLLLLGGALLTLIVVSLRLGGVAQWWPNDWPDHWDTFHLGLDADARVTVLAAAVAGLAWWICTAGSDQIAVQRYLATRNVQTARRALAVSLVAALISATLLTLVGLALLAYFQKSPDHFPAEMSITHDADQLFPHFILWELPPGITGLVIAGLLAAAMSSLSSGVSSACSVIAVDFLDRLGLSATDEAHRMRRTKAISWGVGTTAVIVSTLVGHVQGNLIEVSFKAANVFVGPLFMLFFMAMFVPWATWLGAVAAVIASTMAAVGVAYFGLFGLSFVWMLPVSLLTGVVVGPIISLIHVPRRSERY